MITKGKKSTGQAGERRYQVTILLCNNPSVRLRVTSLSLFFLLISLLPRWQKKDDSSSDQTDTYLVANEPHSTDRPGREEEEILGALRSKVSITKASSEASSTFDRVAPRAGSHSHGIYVRTRRDRCPLFTLDIGQNREALIGLGGRPAITIDNP